MKRLAILLGVALLALVMAICLVSCGDPADTSDGSGDETTGVLEENGIPVFKDGDLVIIDNGKSNYSIVYPRGANLNDVTGTSFTKALSALRSAFKNYGFSGMTISNDAIPLGQEESFVAPKYEILVGATNREESNITDDLGFNEAVIRVVGTKVVIAGKNDAITIEALQKFVDTYVAESGEGFTLPADLDEKVVLNMNNCDETGMTYAAMADEVWDSFNEAYWTGNWVNGGGWWDAAEMLETYVDVYEATGAEEDKEKMLAFAEQFMKNHGISWLGNMYNDDIMWACIAFTRITLLTGNTRYANVARTNFNGVWQRAWDTKLGGGLYWTTDNSTKNSCVNCPAAIAACLLGQQYDSQSYYDIAIKIMDWEIKWMFESNTGRVYDAYPLTGEIGKWASTYNQGTFIGACTLLYKHTGDKTYLNHADKAASYAMRNLTSGGILNNGEGTPEYENGDLPGFKGILTRWLYRYAKEVESLEILSFLQTNAAAAYQNRNADGLIWTTWGSKTPDELTVGYRVFGMSTAVALMYNSQQWW